MSRLQAPVAALLVVAAIVAAWATTSGEGALRLQLIRWQFWVLEAQFVLFVALSWLNLPAFVKSLAPVRSSIIAAGVASLLTLVLVAGVAPRTNRIYYDEHIYEGIAQNLSDLHLAQMCNNGTVEYGSLQCARSEYNKEPYGYPFLLSVAYRLFGVHESIAHRFNTFCAVLLVWVVFLTASGLFDDPKAGAYAAAIAALMPQQIRWSHTAAVEPSAAVMVAMSVMTAVHFARARTVTSLLWMAATAAFAAQFRTEALLVVPMVVIVIALLAPEELTRPGLWWAAVIGLVLCAVHVGHLAVVRGESWGSSGARMSLGYFWPNLEVNGPFYFNNTRFPALYTCLGVAGLVLRPAKGAIVAATLFLVFWGVFLFFYAGSYEFGADVRFSLMSFPALAMLAGRGASMLHRMAVKAGATPLRAATVLIGAVGLSFLWFLPQVRSLGEEAWAARADVEFAERVASGLPRNSIVLTHNPSIFLLNGVNAAQMSLVVTEPAYVATVLSKQYAGGVYLHWNAWCGYADPGQRTVCETAVRSFSSDLVSEYRERDFRYAFYRLHTDGTTIKTTP